MPNPTLQELQAQIEQLKREVETGQAVPLQNIVDALQDSGLENVLNVLQENVSQLTEERQQQTQNLITVLSHSPLFLGQELSRIKAMSAPIDLIEGSVIEVPDQPE